MDVTPALLAPCNGDTGAFFVPGALLDAGALSLSTGGSVSNTGLALNKLGVPTALMAGVGEDEVSDILRALMEKEKGVGTFFHTKAGQATSYSVVLAPQGCDRIFLHNPAANNEFGREDVDFSVLRQAKLFHMGYPSVMRRLYADDGAELCAILREAKALGVTTSLDMAYPSADAMAADWRKILSHALPYTDMILPSVEELLRMLAPETFRRLKEADDDILHSVTFEQIESLAEELLGMGAAVAVIKCGTLGFYAKTADAAAFDERRFGRAAPHDAKAWANRSVFSSVYAVEKVASATGAGDSSIAGFIAALLCGQSLEDAVNLACAAGAVCVTDYSATGAIPSMETLARRMEGGWEKRPCLLTPAGHAWDQARQLWSK